MSDPSFTQAMAELILSSEVSSTRFEGLCVELFCEVDGVDYVTTSPSWDLGRDARSTSVSSKNLHIICCTLSQDLARKVEKDVRRLSEYITPTAIRICSNQRMSEKSVEDISRRVRSLCPGIESVYADGLQQLARLLTRYPRGFERLYRGELANLKDALAVSGHTSQEIALTGMRIALTTQLQEDAQGLREEITRNLILTALAGGEHLTMPSMAKRVSDRLHLPRVVQEDYLRPRLNDLQRTGHVGKESNAAYVITEVGLTELHGRSEEGGKKLVEGQRAIREMIFELAGEKLSNEEFAVLWNALQEEMARMFLVNGIVIIDAIASIVDQETRVSEEPYLGEILSGLRTRVAQLGIFGERGKEVGQAVVDLFEERGSSAFEWLTSLCTIYIGMCSLGLEPSAQDQILSRIRDIHLILDTDVILSYLSEGEAKHEAIQNIVKGWRRINGRLYVAEPVLKEAAYHAWISERDYQATWRQLSTMSDSDMYHLLENAFVRGFKVAAKGNYRPRNWRYYINEFRGEDEGDYTKILDILRADGIELLPTRIADKSFASEVAEKLLELRPHAKNVEEEPSDHLRDKANRDGELVALLDQHRSTRRQVGGTAVLVSSSTFLREACDQYKVRLGVPEPVMAIAPIAYLLALSPGVNLSLGSLRACLFDVGVGHRLALLERAALRVIHASKEYRLHWSRRGVLQRKMYERIGFLAVQRHEKPQAIRKQIVRDTPEGKEMLVEVVASAVDEIARSEIEKERDRLQQRVQELEREAQRKGQRRRK